MRWELIAILISISVNVWAIERAIHQNTMAIREQTSVMKEQFEFEKTYLMGNKMDE